jgi:thiamine-phosphate pyrophosphorylase
VLRYYITDRSQLGGSGELLACIRRNVEAGIDYVQIREKDLSARDLLALTRSAVRTAAGSATRILVNERTDIALAAGAHGVHLRSNAINPTVLRRIVPIDFLIGVSCHSVEDIEAAVAADFVVFGPVFETPGKGPTVGLSALKAAAHVARQPVFALGGVNQQNAVTCVEAGAAGIAAIRMFQDR